MSIVECRICRSLILELTWSPLSQQVQDGSGSEAKQAKFKRSLSMKFGPAKGSTIFETVRYLLATNQRSTMKFVFADNRIFYLI